MRRSTVPSVLVRSRSLGRARPRHPRARRSLTARVAKGPSPLTAIDVFAGLGGSSLGARGARFKIVAAIEKDPVAAKSYKQNVGLEPLVADVREVTGRKLLWGTGLRKGDLTLLVGCPPCQGFTEHRRERRKGWDPRNRLLDEYVRLVGEIYPRFLVFENVPGLARGKGRWRFQRALTSLRRLGYKLRYEVVDAADFGVPQFRRRVLVIGSRVGDPPFPGTTHADPKDPEVRSGKRSPWTTVRDAIADLPKVASGKRTKGDRLHAARKHTDLNLRRLRAIPHDGGGRASLKGDLVLECHKKHDGHWDVYGRMWWDRPAPTLTSGCTNITRGRFAHPVQDRAITLREALRLQGFSRSARLASIGEEASLQIGNAVPPPLAKAAALAVARAERALVRAAAQRAKRRQGLHVGRIRARQRPVDLRARMRAIAKPRSKMLRKAA